ncbi:RND family efflux transporter MFP subunit [Hypnocyclicus thermotrophus]|uniref:RND family efflux transporter MFP subunit n=1 Tax=Hypnocyclicus thermotrophus TaxID=1627895 RepID=A0AA46DYS6_9FUSO|nr:efflux RND transporter periplasmic adaptor subunit [Hypnocyclicus thermotrophus]TDT69887.1 RND family efflux transporter MFP subunit [Hypnocyclicus thermotrophus]
MKKYILVLVTIILFASCGKANNKGVQKVSKETAKIVKTSTLKKIKLSKEIKTNGILNAKYEIVHSGPEAEVEKVYHKNGDFVKKGDIIVKQKDINIENNYKMALANLNAAKSNYEQVIKFSEIQVRTQLEQAKSAMISAEQNLIKAKKGAKVEQIEIAKNNLKTAESAFEQAKFNYEKNKKLYDEKLISESAFLQLETMYNQSKNQLDNAKNNLELLIKGADEEDIKILEAMYEQAKANYELVKKNVDEESWKYTINGVKAQYDSALYRYEMAKKAYDDLTIKAKISGVVSGLNLKKYQKAKPDNGPFFTIIDESSMETVVYLSVSEVINLDKNSFAEVNIEELNNTFKGKIDSIDPAASKSTNKFAVKIVIDNNKNMLKKGMYGKISLFTNPKEKLVVPKKSIVIKGLYKYIYKLEGDRVKAIKVELGVSNDEYQEVIADKLKVGDKIVVDGQFLLQDNDLVKEVN